jgi:hypothetical protein
MLLGGLEFEREQAPGWLGLVVGGGTVLRLVGHTKQIKALRGIRIDPRQQNARRMHDAANWSKNDA